MKSKKKEFKKKRNYKPAMKKSAKGEVVLSACQVQAARLNKLEYRRLQRNVTVLRETVDSHIARIQRQEQGLRYHFTNVVRVIKPNRAYQLWKQAHADEIAQDEANDLIETIKLKQKSKLVRRKETMPPLRDPSTEPLRPLLLLIDNENEKPAETIVNISDAFFRPKTSPSQNHSSSSSRRVNPLLNMLDSSPTSSINMSRQHQQSQNSLDAFSHHSLSSMGTTSSKKLTPSKLGNPQNAADLDALYRMALQNQTAYKPVEQQRISQRKLQDKDFASQYRALKGSLRSASCAGYSN